MDDLDVKLFTLIKGFQSSIALNNLLVKEKIQRKLALLSTLKHYGFSIMNYPPELGNKIIEQLYKIESSGDIVRYTNKTNKLLGAILHNAYQCMGYNLILSDIPEYCLTCDDSRRVKVDANAIFETLADHAPHKEMDIECVMQLGNNSYLAKIKTNNIAHDLAELLNGKMMDNKIIKVDYIEPLILPQSNIIEHITDADPADANPEISSNTSSNTSPNTPPNQFDLCPDPDMESSKSESSIPLSIYARINGWLNTFTRINRWMRLIRW